MKTVCFAALALMTSMNLIACQQPQKILSDMQLKITVGEHVLFADLYDNATAKSFVQTLPRSLPMQDLYRWEMVYRFKEALPAHEAHTCGYAVGDISYWTPRHSFVIFYKQNGEIISNLQKVGHIQQGVEYFQQTGASKVQFELVSKQKSRSK